MKTCTGCGEFKALDEFTNDSKNKDGKAQKCRVCSKAIHARWLSKNPNYGANQMRRKRAQRTPEQHAADNEVARLREERRRRKAGMRTHEEHVAEQKAEAARVRALPPPISKICCTCKKLKLIEEYSRATATCDGHTPKCKACSSDEKNAWVKSRVEWLAAYAKDYAENNWETIANNARRRRAREKNAPGEDHTVEQVQDLWRRSGGVCTNIYCGVPIHEGHRHLDHIVPLARGGSNAIENLQFLCPKCNHTKHAKMPDEWEEEQRRRAIAWMLS